MKCLFFDDSKKHIECFYRENNTIIEPYLIQFKQIFSPKTYRTKFIQENPQNIYAPYEQQFVSPFVDAFGSISQGLYNTEFDIIYKWIETNKEEEKIILFDFDHTISITDGFITFDRTNFYTFDNTTKTQYYNDLLNYIIGKHRINDIKKLFNFIKEHNVEVRILTNNSIFNDFKFECFIMLKYIIPHIKIDNIFYCNKHEFKNKLDFVKQHKDFEKFCNYQPFIGV